MVFASIITIGDELLIGQTVDTNSAFIATELNKIGIWVKRRLAVGDLSNEIMDALESQSKDCQIIIITGGLGPTADDITKPTLCDFFGAKLVRNEEVLQNVKQIFDRFNRPLTERNIKQADVPDTCTVLHNRFGTAPGMWFEKNNIYYISLPGVPHEMMGLMQETVIPKLKENLSLPVILHKTLLTAGIGESTAADILADFEKNLPPHIKLAYLPSNRMVRLRLTGNADNAATLSNEIEEQFAQLKALVKEWMIADEDVTIQEAVANLLEAKQLYLATAESCTGGYLAHLFTVRPGSSNTFKGDVVSYANEAKENALGVAHTTLQAKGAVSEETVTEMAQGVLRLMDADYALATSGIMGPTGGTPEKPVGTVWVAVANKHTVKAEKYRFHYDRRRNIDLTASAALTLLHKFITEEESLKKQ